MELFLIILFSLVGGCVTGGLQALFYNARDNWRERRSLWRN
jgi:hypothetical protein